MIYLCYLIRYLELCIHKCELKWGSCRLCETFPEGETCLEGLLQPSWVWWDGLLPSQKVSISWRGQLSGASTLLISGAFVLLFSRNHFRVNNKATRVWRLDGLIHPRIIIFSSSDLLFPTASFADLKVGSMQWEYSTVCWHVTISNRITISRLMSLRLMRS